MFAAKALECLLQDSSAQLWCGCHGTWVHKRYSLNQSDSMIPLFNTKAAGNTAYLGLSEFPDSLNTIESAKAAILPTTMRYRLSTRV